jgi:hypothetical protein
VLACGGALRGHRGATVSAVDGMMDGSGEKGAGMGWSMERHSRDAQEEGPWNLEWRERIAVARRGEETHVYPVTKTRMSIMNLTRPQLAYEVHSH